MVCFSLSLDLSRAGVDHLTCSGVDHWYRSDLTKKVVSEAAFLLDDNPGIELVKATFSPTFFHRICRATTHPFCGAATNGGAKGPNVVSFGKHPTLSGRLATVRWLDRTDRLHSKNRLRTVEYGGISDNETEPETRGIR